MPIAKAVAVGADVANPQRFAGRSAKRSPRLGEPSGWMTGEQRECWQAYRAEMPWLNETHRCLVEIAAVLRARLWSGGEVGVQALGQLRLCLSAMGGTPTDETKVTGSDEDGKDDGVAGYFN